MHTRAYQQNTADLSRFDSGDWHGRQRFAFTLTELMVAVVVLLVVIIGIARIFSTASQVTSVGQATASVSQEIAAIQRLIREDFKRLSHEGLFIIQSRSVRNNINGPTQLLNPSLPPDARIRADQLVFFTQGVAGSTSARVSEGASTKGQGAMARVYYGHGFQVPGAPPADYVVGNPYQSDAYDVDPSAVVFPWNNFPVDLVATEYSTTGLGGNPYSFTSAGSIPLVQPEARQWLLVRQPVILVDDDQNPPNDDSKTVYMNQVMAARSLLYDDPAAGLSPQIRDGRVDAAASRINDLRARIAVSFDPWYQIGGNNDQRDFILNQLMYYPRAERQAPSGHRVDQALTNTVLGSACSNFIVEWTYDAGVGDAVNVNGVQYRGAIIDRTRPVQWFGMEDTTAPDRGVRSFTNWNSDSDGDGYPPIQSETIFPENIEGNYTPGSSDLEVYAAVFGFNQSQPFDIDGIASTLEPSATYGEPIPEIAYTPWPTAVRITMTLHDPKGALESGVEVQFVIRLPEKP